jgi:hypothetical protein
MMRKYHVQFGGGPTEKYPPDRRATRRWPTLRNAIYAGRGTARTLVVLPDGRVLNERALAKLRALDSGHAYVEHLLRGFGAPPRRGADPAEWLPRALAAAGVRRLRHPGNHRYLFRLGDRAARRSVFVALPSLPYPNGTDQPTELAA